MHADAFLSDLPADMLCDKFKISRMTFSFGSTSQSKSSGSKPAGGGFSFGVGAAKGIEVFAPAGSSIDEFLKVDASAPKEPEQKPRSRVTRVNPERLAKFEEVKLQGVHLERAFIVRNPTGEEQEIGPRFQRKVAVGDPERL